MIILAVAINTIFYSIVVQYDIFDMIFPMFCQIIIIIVARGSPTENQTVLLSHWSF